jgi:hypothetical protein
MNEYSIKKQIQSVVRTGIQHGFNRSIGALESAKAIDSSIMREEYKGVGSKYYDLVTEQMEFTEKQLESVIDEIVENINKQINDNKNI